MRMNRFIYIIFALLLLVSVAHSECVGFQCNAVKFIGHGVINIFVPDQNADVYSASIPGSLTNVSSYVFTNLWGMTVVGNQIIEYVKNQTDINVPGSIFQKASQNIGDGYDILTLVGTNDPMNEIEENIKKMVFLTSNGLGILPEDVKKLISIDCPHEEYLYAPWWYDIYGANGHDEKCKRPDSCNCADGNCNCEIDDSCNLTSNVNEYTGKYDPTTKYKYSNIYGNQPTLNIAYNMDIIIKGKIARYYYFIAKYAIDKFLKLINDKRLPLDTIKIGNDVITSMNVSRDPFKLVFRISDYPIIINCTNHNGQYYHVGDKNRYNAKCSGNEFYSCGATDIKGLKKDPCDTEDEYKHCSKGIENGGCPPADSHKKYHHDEEVDSVSDFEPNGCNFNYLLNQLTIPDKNSIIKIFINPHGKIKGYIITTINRDGSLSSNTYGDTTRNNGGRELDFIKYKYRYHGHDRYITKFAIGKVDKSNDCVVKMTMGPNLCNGIGFFFRPIPESDKYTYCKGDMTHHVTGDPENIPDICCWATGGVVMYNPGYYYFCKGDGFCDYADGERPWNSFDCSECSSNRNSCWTGSGTDDCDHVPAGRTITISGNCKAKCIGHNKWAWININDCCKDPCKDCSDYPYYSCSGHTEYNLHRCKLPGYLHYDCSLDIDSKVSYTDGNKCSCKKSCDCSSRCGGNPCNGRCDSPTCCDSTKQCCATYDPDGNPTGYACCDPTTGCKSASDGGGCA